MKVIVGNQEYESHIQTAEPVIVVDAEELGERHSVGIGHVDIVGKTGEKARFWIEFRMVNGRPTLTMITKPDKHRLKSVQKDITGTFNIL